ncbi:MAG: hypothetical protein JNL57_10565 [Bacteroidetes bacterium]|nr:hypothetical protein [Bacteroidota bacterium]
MKGLKSASALLTTVICFALLVSCNSSPKKAESAYRKMYDHARLAQDYHTAISALTLMAVHDSAGNPWVYDSLAFYHYFYNYTPGVVRNPNTPLYYAQKGLDIAPGNVFLKELKGKLQLEMGKDTLSYNLFSELWQQTHDYTYWWDMTFIQLGARGRFQDADSMILMVMSTPESDSKKVRLEHIPERMREEVPAKAAFLYLKGIMLNAQKQPLKAAETWNEALKIAPDFYAVKRSFYEMQQAAQQGR